MCYDITTCIRRIRTLHYTHTHTRTRARARTRTHARTHTHTHIMYTIILLKGALYIIQILCRRYTLWSYPAGLTIADAPGKQKLKYRRVYSHHIHTTIAESIHTTPNSIQCPFKSVCRCYQTAGRNSCSNVSGNVSNCSYRPTVNPVTSARLISA